MIELSLTTIGTGNALPDAQRGPTSQLIRYGASSIVVDLGSGALHKLARAGVSVFDMDALVLTHAHIDHIADCLPLLFALSVLKKDRARPLEIFASSTTRDYLHAVQKVFGAWLDAPAKNVVWRTIAPGERYDVAGLSLATGTVQHSESSVALRFETPDGRRIAIPGDTAPHAPLVDFVRDVELLVIECGNPSGVETRAHLSPASLASLLKAAQPAVAVVTHRPLELDGETIQRAASPDFKGALHVPGDLETFVVTHRDR